MLTCKGGLRVGRGTYWDLGSGRRVDVATELVLPGDASSTYLKMPPAVMLLSGPIVGLVYVLLLPVIGMVVVAGVVGGKLLDGAYRLVAKSLSFGWTPRSAYLSGKRRAKRKEKPSKP